MSSLRNGIYKASEISDKNFFHMANVAGSSFEGDFSDFNFKGAHLYDAKFSEDSVLPQNPSFFKELVFSRISNSILPKFDLSKYDLRNVTFLMVRFHPQTILPKNRGLFEYDEVAGLGTIFSRCWLPVLNLVDYDLIEQVSCFNCILHFDTVIPKFKNFFIEFCKKNESKRDCFVFPKRDYSAYDFCPIKSFCYHFAEGSILPIDDSFFVQLGDRVVKDAMLPSQDYSRCDFKDVLLRDTTFGESAKLPKDIFQQVRGKNVAGCNFPVLDYSDFSFQDSVLSYCKFPDGAVLPDDLLRQISCPSGNLRIQLPSEFIKNLLFQELPDFVLDISENEIDNDTLLLLQAKFRNNIKLILPQS